MDLLRNLVRKSNTLETVCKLFKLLDVKVTMTTLEEYLDNHPDYPSLLSISDVLTSFGIENISLKTSVTQLAQMPMPCVAPIKINKYDEKFTIIKSVTDKGVSFLNPESLEFENIPIAEFVTKWPSGVLMLTDAETAKGEEGYLGKKREERRDGLLKFGTYAAFPLLVFLASIMLLLSAGVIALFPVVYINLMLTGLVTSGLLLWYEVDDHNLVLQKICKSVGKVNCSAILGSKTSKLAGIGWSSIGFVYFFAGVIFLLVQGMLNGKALFITGWLSILALPYILFSIYYQWRVARQWCVLCLTVQGVLTTQGLVVLLAGWLARSEFADITSMDILLPFIISYLIPATALGIALPAFRLSRTGKQRQSELSRFKHNPQIFQALLAQQKELNESTSNLGIILGNPNAIHKIIKVCNPYCGPCARVHAPMEELLNNNPEVQIQIIFTASDDENDSSAAPVRHLLAIQQKHGEEITRQALDDWYLASKKDYNTFARKYAMNGEVSKQADNLKAMRQWCDKTNITFTPTFFLNGRQLPDAYSVNDLKYLLSV